MKSMHACIVSCAAALVVVASAGCDDVPNDALESCKASQVAPATIKTDILFVIDDSQSMSQEQTALQNALGAFIDVLSNSPVRNDFQIGVTTTSVDSGLAGRLASPGIMTSSSPTLVADFQSAVMVGIGGSWWEQPFEAAKLAIQRSTVGGTNEGFIRPGARLAIFFLSDEDDCSVGTAPGSSANCRAMKDAGTLYPISRYTDFLRGPIEGELKNVILYAVAGFSQTTLAPSCGSCSDNTCSTAMDKGDRFLELTRSFGTAGRIGSICDPSFDGALTEFAGAIMSQQMPLDGAVADPGLLVVRVTKPSGEMVSCGQVAAAGTSEAATANVIYAAPEGGQPATLWFQFDCALDTGYRVDLDVICAG